MWKRKIKNDKTLKGKRKTRLSTPESYRRYLHKARIARFGVASRVSLKADSPANRETRAMVARLLVEVMGSGANVVFFDTSGVYDTSFKNKFWHRRDQRNIRHASDQRRTIKILAATTLEGLVGIQMFRKLMKDSVPEFVAKCIRRCQVKAPHRPVWLFLDNAPLHKSESFTKMAADLVVPILYNAISSPELNPAEKVFEIVKSRLRQESSMSPASIIRQIVLQARKMSSGLYKKIAAQHYDALAKVLRHQGNLSK